MNMFMSANSHVIPVTHNGAAVTQGCLVRFNNKKFHTPQKQNEWNLDKSTGNEPQAISGSKMGRHVQQPCRNLIIVLVCFMLLVSPLYYCQFGGLVKRRKIWPRLHWRLSLIYLYYMEGTLYFLPLPLLHSRTLYSKVFVCNFEF